MSDVQFDDFVASEPEAVTTEPLTDEEIINLVCTENDASQEESEDEQEEETLPAKVIKSTAEFLAIINQQKAFMKRNNLPVELVKQLVPLVVANQIALCSRQKKATDYFKTASETSKPKDVYKTVGDVSHDVTIL